MFDFNQIAIFVEVVDAGSFTSAANRLAIPKSTVSRKVSQLEKRLQTRLLHRTTRAMRVTEEGRVYYEYCRQIVEQARLAEEVVSGLQSKPTGTLRISAPMAVGTDILPPLLKVFLQHHEELKVELLLTDSAVDLLAQNIDLALSANPATSSTSISRHIATAPRIICASASYLEERGMPLQPEQLSTHDTLAFSSWHDSHEWQLRRSGVEKRISITAKYSANDVASVLASTLSGLGIAMLPKSLVSAHIASGELVSILTEWELRADRLYLQYPGRIHLPPKVRAFIDFLMTQEKLLRHLTGEGSA